MEENLLRDEIPLNWRRWQSFAHQSVAPENRAETAE
jgi:hypothetical protein